MLGFILTRRVVSDETNRYWNQSYRTIRMYYPKNMIMIIDDGSDPRHVRLEEGLVLENCFLVSSEFRGAGEVLPYYYFLQHRLFDKAVILHDSVFFQSFVDFDRVQTVSFVWHFSQHIWDNVGVETGLLRHLEDSFSLLGFYFQKHRWHGCFGGQCVITYDFLKQVEDRHRLTRMVPHVQNRTHRYAVERVLGCLFTSMERSLSHTPSLFGSIFAYMPWGYTFDMLLDNPLPSLPLVKVWSKR